MTRLLNITAILAVIWAVFFTHTAFSSTKAALWERHYGGGKRDKAFAIQSLSDGGSVISGYTRSSGKGDSDIWVMRINAAGKPLWEQTFGGQGSEVSTAITTLKDGGFLVAAYSQNLKKSKKEAWLIRLNGYGKKIWDRKYSGLKGGRPYAIIATPDGGAVVAGLTFKKETASEYQGWVFKVDSGGKKVWERIVGSKGKDWLRSLALLPNGDIIVVGAQEYHFVKASLTPEKPQKLVQQAAWALRLSSAGKTIWDKTYFTHENVARSVAVQKNGQIAVAGWTRSANKYGKDTWILSLDGKGKVLWKKSFGGSGQDKIDGITVLEGGVLVLACITEKHFPMMTVNTAWLLAVDRKGKVLWERAFGNGRADQVHAITTLTDGRIAVAGGTWRSGKSTDAWVFTLSQTGQVPKKKVN